MEEKMRNIVVLKNLPSNLVEEAIVILKANKKKIKCVKNIASKNEKSKPQDYIVKEAEMVISNYISGIENQKLVINKKKYKNIEKKYKRMKFVTLVISIALVIVSLV